MCAARVSCFVSCLPNHGIGALSMEHRSCRMLVGLGGTICDPSSVLASYCMLGVSSPEDESSPQTDYYAEQATRAAALGVAIDLLVVSVTVRGR